MLWLIYYNFLALIYQFEGIFFIYSSYLLFILLWEFFTPALADGFYWSLNDNHSHQVSQTFLSIPADLNNAEDWIISTCPLISKSSSPFINPLGIVPSAPITIGITVTFMFHSCFNSLARFRNLSLFSLSFYFTLCSTGTTKSTILQFLFLLLIISRCSSLAEIRWSIYWYYCYYDNYSGQITFCNSQLV